MTIEQVAKIVHDANKSYCQSIGDNSQVSWELTAPWQQNSAINGVKYKLDNPNATPEDQHIAWSNDKIKDGWVYGDVKDAELKTHPCLVDYSDLPEEQQVKDHLFTGIVKALKPFIV